MADIISPVGRLVQGHPMEKQTTNQQGQPLKTLSGQDTQRYFTALAFAKTDATFPPFYQQMAAAARAAWPQHFDAQGNCTHPRFSMKLMDGDGVDENGRSNATKDGFAGHWIVKFQTSFPPKCYHTGHYQAHEMIQDPEIIKRGYFGRVLCSFDSNKNQSKPGIYVNMNGFELVGHGPIIVSGPDIGAAFAAAAPAAMPAGMQPLPMHAHQPMAAPGGMPAPQPMGAMPGMTSQPMAAAPGLPPLGSPGMTPGLPMGSPVSAGPGLPPLNAGVPGASPAMMSPTNMVPAPMQQVAVAPNPAFLAGPGGVPGAMPALAQPAGPQLRTITMEQYSAYRQQGYDDNALRAHGMIA